jgi:RNA polymerase sigma-70 factor (ECF subfamily)
MAASRTLPPLQSRVPVARTATAPDGCAELQADPATATASSSAIADAIVPDPSPSQARPTFRDVFDRFADYVPALLRRLGVTPADVPDLAQEVFVVVYQRLPTFRGDSSLKTWVCGISLRIASNHRRRAWVRRLVLFGDLDRHPALTEPFDTLEMRERIAILDAVLARLPARERDVFVLFEVEELPMSEIALLLGCAQKTAYTRLYAARKNVARALSRGEPKRRTP